MNKWCCSPAKNLGVNRDSLFDLCSSSLSVTNISIMTNSIYFFLTSCVLFCLVFSLWSRMSTRQRRMGQRGLSPLPRGERAGRAMFRHRNDFLSDPLSPSFFRDNLLFREKAAQILRPRPPPPLASLIGTPPWCTSFPSPSPPSVKQRPSSSTKWTTPPPERWEMSPIRAGCTEMTETSIIPQRGIGSSALRIEIWVSILPRHRSSIGWTERQMPGGRRRREAEETPPALKSQSQGRRRPRRRGGGHRTTLPSQRCAETVAAVQYRPSVRWRGIVFSSIASFPLLTGPLALAPFPSSSRTTIPTVRRPPICCGRR